MTMLKLATKPPSRAWKYPRNSSTKYYTRSITNKTKPTPYDSTITNLKLTSSTRVIFQGFTGRVGTSNAQESIAWGTNIVGGVKPNASPNQTHLGLPVLPTVREAVKVLRPDATGIYVAAHQAAGAIEEAIEAEIPLIVAVAEHIPVHSMLRIHAMLRTQDRCRLVGANAPGIISPIAKCRIGFQPLAQYMPGLVGIVAKSGTLSYETVASLTRAGVGQSLCIGMGGDMVAGTDFVDALRVFEDDDDTQGIVIVGEVGGRAEEDAAEWITEYRKNSKNPKPISAIVGGISNIEGRVFGHAGAWRSIGENDAASKFKALQRAGAVMVDHPAKFGNTMKRLLSLSSPSRATSRTSMDQQQRRSIYVQSCNATRPKPHLLQQARIKTQRRSMSLGTTDSLNLLKSYGIIAVPRGESSSERTFDSLTGICIDRQSRQPALVVQPTRKTETNHTTYIPFNILEGPTNADVDEAVKLLPLEERDSKTIDKLRSMYQNLYRLFIEKEASQLLLCVGGGGQISDPDLMFDDAAFRIGKRHQDLHALRYNSTLAPEELAAEPHGIVYVRLGDDAHNVGTLVNGAGLAMNAVDALAERGVKAINFMDTGGLATSATVATGFGLLLSDPRVKVIFVNIFGGLTLGDMIARGILMAFKEKDVAVPVVVRIRGTNEKEGQKLIQESGLPLFAYDDFEEAVEKVKDLLRS